MIEYFLEKLEPELYDHLVNDLETNIEVFAISWIMSLFGMILPLSSMVFSTYYYMLVNIF